jgi:hypothetical protein
MSGRLDGRERGASVDPDLPQDPGIPGPKVPEELPPQDEPEVERVPDSDQPDYDEEGSRNPKGHDPTVMPCCSRRRITRA